MDSHWGFQSHGGIHEWLVCNGTSHLKMDDGMGYPYDSGKHHMSNRQNYCNTNLVFDAPFLSEVA